MTITGTDRWVPFAPRAALVGERKPLLIGTLWKNSVLSQWASENKDG